MDTRPDKRATSEIVAEVIEFETINLSDLNLVAFGDLGRYRIKRGREPRFPLVWNKLTEVAPGDVFDLSGIRVGVRVVGVDVVRIGEIDDLGGAELLGDLYGTEVGRTAGAIASCDYDLVICRHINHIVRVLDHDVIRNIAEDGPEEVAVKVSGVDTKPIKIVTGEGRDSPCSVLVASSGLASASDDNKTTTGAGRFCGNQIFKSGQEGGVDAVWDNQRSADRHYDGFGHSHTGCIVRYCGRIIKL